MMFMQKTHSIMCIVLVWGFIVIAITQIWSRLQTLPNEESYLNSEVTESPKQFTASILKYFKKRLSSMLSNTTHVNLTNVDLSLQQIDPTILRLLVKELPSLPKAYLNTSKNSRFYVNVCAHYPIISELEFNNVHWQSLYTLNGTFHLLNAYYDVRALSSIGPSVRVVAMINRWEPTVQTYCQFWFETFPEPVIVVTLEYKLIWHVSWKTKHRPGVFLPYLITCKIPKKYLNTVPASVSIKSRLCNNATNNLRVIYNRPAKGRKKDFAVCVKGLDFAHVDLSAQLVEWIELLGILGVDKIFFYQLHVHPNMKKVLDYYERLDRVEVTPITLPGGQPNAIGLQHLYNIQVVNRKRMNELIPYNDCLYKNLYSYKYIAVLDIDEVIIPVTTKSWRELMDIVVSQALEKKNVTPSYYYVKSFTFFNNYTDNQVRLNNIPSYMHMLSNVNRRKVQSKPYSKSVIDPERVLTVHNHCPLALFDSNLTARYTIALELAQLQHYRISYFLKNSKKKPTKAVNSTNFVDTGIWKFKEQLIQRVASILNHLDLLNN